MYSDEILLAVEKIIIIWKRFNHSFRKKIGLLYTRCYQLSDLSNQVQTLAVNPIYQYLVYLKNLVEHGGCMYPASGFTNTASHTPKSDPFEPCILRA